MLNSNLNKVKSKVILIFYIFLFTISFVPNVSASCSEGQININDASKEELDKIYGIGPVKAQAIIDSRSFDSVDDLIKVNGIGQITLDKIKDQNLACVKEENEEGSNDNEPVEEKSQEEDESDKEKNVNRAEELELNTIEKQNEVSVINLTKDIKIEDNNENKYRTYAIYGFVVFCILLIVLFILRKNRFENEFN